MVKKLHNHLGEQIDFTYTQGNDPSKKDWIVLVAHGVTGNKDRPIVVDSASAANFLGFSTITFSFSGNGNSEGRFIDSTISKEVQEVSSIIQQLGAKRIIYIGHSMGSAVGLLASIQNPEIRYLVSLAGMINTKKFADSEFGTVTPDKGFMWDDETCPLSSTFMEDLCENVTDLLPKVTQVSVPWLLLHGTEDDVVLPDDTRNVSEVMGSAVDVHFIKDGDHSFNEAARKPTLETLANWLGNLRL
jgi:pimeloyl-ACP methyl ester carboxylesterase